MKYYLLLSFTGFFQKDQDKIPERSFSISSLWLSKYSDAAYTRDQVHRIWNVGWSNPLQLGCQQGWTSIVQCVYNISTKLKWFYEHFVLEHCKMLTCIRKATGSMYVIITNMESACGRYKLVTIQNHFWSPYQSLATAKMTWDAIATSREQDLRERRDERQRFMYFKKSIAILL